jgi:glycosyltransferase involved in cell wall biosynthesis
MKILALSDSPMRSGFGRIANEVFYRLVYRGHQVHVASLLWDGIALVDQEDWYSPVKSKLPFQISGLAGRDWGSYIYNLIGLTNPDVVISLQDFPYATGIFYNCRVDWSKRAFVCITPIDGFPIDEDWLRLVDDADGTMVISEFGVEAMKKAGRQVELCPPGIDRNYFKPASPEEKKALRLKVGIPEDAFVVGMMAMNQGRKDIPHTLDGFAKFSVDKPEARLLLDMDASNPAGWNIPKLMKTKNIPEGKVLFRENLGSKGVTELRDRYALLDCHVVLAHREGFGLPLIESQAMMIPTISQDWCSGTEICGNGKGYLIRHLSQSRNSTWGGAYDYDPDVEHFVQVLETIYKQPIQAKAIAERGYEWAIARTWDKTADSVENLLLKIEEKQNARKFSLSNLRTTTISDETSAKSVEPQAGISGGSSPDGRPQSVVQPDGANGPTVQRDAGGQEQRLREDGERGGQDGPREVRLLPELRHTGS